MHHPERSRARLLSSPWEWMGELINPSGLERDNIMGVWDGGESVGGDGRLVLYSTPSIIIPFQIFNAYFAKNSSPHQHPSSSMRTGWRLCFNKNSISVVLRLTLRVELECCLKLRATLFDTGKKWNTGNYSHEERIRFRGKKREKEAFPFSLQEREMPFPFPLSYYS